jgi:ABC-type glutathione transport system ATPase component
MTTLYQKIGEEFLSRLANSKEIDSKKVESLRPHYFREKSQSAGTREHLYRLARERSQMIKLESIHIEEVRGIRKLDLDFKKQTLAIHGPNGSGKSGIIDAIEFGLTGQMGRLMGKGTKGLSVTMHGPHVDKFLLLRGNMLSRGRTSWMPSGFAPFFCISKCCSRAGLVSRQVVDFPMH